MGCGGSKEEELDDAPDAGLDLPAAPAGGAGDKHWAPSRVKQV